MRELKAVFEGCSGFVVDVDIGQFIDLIKGSSGFVVVVHVNLLFGDKWVPFAIC